MDPFRVWSVRNSSMNLHCSLDCAIVAGTEIVTEISWQAIWHVGRELNANN